MKKTFEVIVHASEDVLTKEVRFHIFLTDMTSYGGGYVVVKKATVEVEVPDNFDIRQPMINALEQQRQKAMADHHALMSAIDGEIQKLKCIEHKEVA